MMVGEDGMPIADAPSDAATFSNLNPNTSDADLMGGNTGAVIWGTNVSIQHSFKAMRDFLFNFEKKYRMIADGELEEGATLDAGHPGREKEYVSMMETMLDLGVRFLYLDARNLKSYPPTRKLWHQLQSFPSEIIPLMDTCIKDTIVEMAERKMDSMRSAQSQQRQNELNRTRDLSSAPPMPSSDVDHNIGGQTPTPAHAAEDIPDLVTEAEQRIYRVRPFGMDKTINLRDLNPGDMDKMVSVKGLVIRTTPVIPDMKDAFFRCSVCHHTVKVDIDRGKIAEPTRCPRVVCESANSMQIVHNRSGFADKQVIKLQETPDSVPDGQTPHSVSLCAYDELVDMCKAGWKSQASSSATKCA
jgi:DNA replication licensing factor MCM4